MTLRARRGLEIGALFLLGLAGTWLRLVRWSDWPPGPWIDEAYAIRAARLTAGAPLCATTPLEPPEAGFVNAFVSNLYLAFARGVDQLAGGGIASFRALSIGPAILLLLASFLLAWEAARERPGARLAAALLLASSMWLLTTGRWGWDVVATTALVVLACWAALVAARLLSGAWAAGAGALVGLAQYGSLAARLAALALPLLLLHELVARRRQWVRMLGLAILTGAAVAMPLGLHLLAHPERAVARSREISLATRPAAEAVSGLAGNAADYAALFFLRGDRNERHGSRERPVVPLPVAALALFGCGIGLLRGGVERLLLLPAALFLLGGLLTSGGANAYRISPAAPFLLVLAALGGTEIVERLPDAARRVGAIALGGLLVVSSASDVAGFTAWASAPRTWGAFGGPERDLADAFRALAGPAGADFALNRETASRNEVTVDVLLARPEDAGRHAVHLLALAPGSGWRWVPNRDVLYADSGAPEVRSAVERLGGREVARGRVFLPAPAWVLYRIPREAAAGEAQRLLGRFESLAPSAGGNLHAEEDGLYTFAARGGIEAALEGRTLFGPGTRPAGTVQVLLSRGAYRLEQRVVGTPGELRVIAPSGFLAAWSAIPGSLERAE